LRTSNYGEAAEPAGDGGDGSEAAPLRCGDCHSPVHPPAEESASPAQAEDVYCPLCAAEVRAPLRCADCGSTICPVCGAPVELVDELGIG
jgi:DNA-directed RNA polymerase subunit RPC12/RpoP